MATFSKRQSIFVCSEVNALMKMGRSHGVSCSLGSLIYSTLTGFTPWEDQLVKCGTSNFHPWKSLKGLHLQALYLNDPDTHSELLGALGVILWWRVFQEQQEDPKKWLTVTTLTGILPKLFSGDTPMVFSCFFLGFFKEKNTLQLDQIAARLPGFTIGEGVGSSTSLALHNTTPDELQRDSGGCTTVVGCVDGHRGRFQGPLMDGWGCEDERDQWCVGKEIPRRMLLLIRFSSWKTSATSSF